MSECESVYIAKDGEKRERKKKKKKGKKEEKKEGKTQKRTRCAQARLRT